MPCSLLLPLPRRAPSQDSISDLKARLATALELPAGKQKLSRDGVGFLQDGLSLAHYNVGGEVVLTLGLKERGGKKKQ